MQLLPFCCHMILIGAFILLLFFLSQQAKVIEKSIDFKVGVYCGSTKQLKSHEDWDKEIEQYEVVMLN